MEKAPLFYDIGAPPPCPRCHRRLTDILRQDGHILGRCHPCGISECYKIITGWKR